MTGAPRRTLTPGHLVPLAALGVILCILLQSSASVFSRLAGLFSHGREAAFLILNPWSWAMWAALALQALIWPLVLRRTPVSTAYPCMALVFPLNLLFAWWGLRENVEWEHSLGTLLILAGVAIIVREDAPK